MKKTIYLLTLLFLSACAFSFSTCSESIDELAEDLMKLHSTDYLHNETDQDVTVTFPDNNSYLVRKSQVLEIPHAEYLCVSSRYLESDSVVFVFADGTRMVHSYTNKMFDQEQIYFVYKPVKNNIFYIGYDIPTEKETWVRSQVGTNKVRYDYFIRRDE